MRGELIALDLETTGLSITDDAIIEIGAVRFQGDKVLQEYSTLINPGVDIPFIVSSLTGIDTEDVEGAPKIESVLPAFTEFVGGAPIVAHNVGFDIGFLHRYDLFHENSTLDTLELASVLMPRSPRYNLGSLAMQLGISLENAHRALDDARATAYLYWALWEKALALPPAILMEITQSAQQTNWNTGTIFETALKEVVQDQELPTSTPYNFPIFQKTGTVPTPLTPKTDKYTIDVKQIRSILEEGGSLSQAIPDDKHRPQQIMISEAIANAFNVENHLLMEAGNGKTLAYLVPAILQTLATNQRAVIATNTVDLQEQLLQTDIPLIREALDSGFNVALMKERNNYLCPHRLEIIRHQITNQDELRALAKILIWLLESKTGEKKEITLRGNEYRFWERISARHEDCGTLRCSTEMQGICPFYNAHRTAEAANIIVANQSLIISDTLTENHILPEYQHLIVDEVHMFENAITQSLRIDINQPSLIYRLKDIGGQKNSLLGNIIQGTQGIIPTSQHTKLDTFIENIVEAISLMQVHVKGFFQAVYHYLTELEANKKNKYTQKAYWISTQQRDKGNFGRIQAAWADLSPFFEALIDAITHLRSAIEKMEEFAISHVDTFLNRLSASSRFLMESRQYLHEFVIEPDQTTVYWIKNANNPDEISIHAAPLHIGSMLEENIFQQKKSVILTSDTLQIQSGFSYIRDRLYADDMPTVEVESHAHSKESTLFYVAEDIPEPNRPHYQQEIERGIIELASILDGHTLVLFTSYAQLKETTNAISPRLALGNINVYDQNSHVSREATLEAFQRSPNTVLMGTRGFWEGINIPSELLKALVIVRLPFAVPSEPIFAARSSTYQHGFEDYAVPDAILRFRQDFSRFIQIPENRGVITIFDSRIASKSYGRRFLDSLPSCTIKRGPLQTLPDTARKWLQLPQAEL